MGTAALSLSGIIMISDRLNRTGMAWWVEFSALIGEVCMLGVLVLSILVTVVVGHSFS